MNELLEKSSSLRPVSTISNTSLNSSYKKQKLKFGETNEKTQQQMNRTTNSNLNTSLNRATTTSTVNSKTKNSTHNNSLNTSLTHHIKPPVKKPIIEYNSYSDNKVDQEKNTLYSTWTPLADEESNNKLFEERRLLVNKWFDNWNDKQRKMVMEDLIMLCKPKQLMYTKDVLNKVAPVYHYDFTRLLPRVLSLYIFSFLDPRSLSRSAQVSWYWKTLSESDHLWMPKCLRFNWTIDYVPSPFETGIWKRFYIHNIKALQLIPIKDIQTPIGTARTEYTVEDLKSRRFESNRSFLKNFNKLNLKLNPSSLEKRPPWKGNSFNPNHFYRFNYLDNDAAAKRANHLIKTLSLEAPPVKPNTTLDSSVINQKPKNTPTSVHSTKSNVNNNRPPSAAGSKRPNSAKSSTRTIKTNGHVNNENSFLNSTNNTTKPVIQQHKPLHDTSTTSIKARTTTPSTTTAITPSKPFYNINDDSFQAWRQIDSDDD